MKKQIWLFLLLAFGITWLVWITAQFFGAGPDSGEYILAFGSGGPALAAILLSRNGREKAGERQVFRILRFAVLWLFAWPIYIANDNLRGLQAPHALPYYSLVGLLAMIPAGILSGAFTRDAGVLKLLDAFTRPGGWRWQAFALLFWPVLLLAPAAVVYLMHGALVMPRHPGSLGRFALYAVVLFLANLLFTAALEEPGWRGFLLPRLEQRFSPLLATILVWFPWALWHAPLDFHKPFRFSLVQYVLIRVVFFIPISVILTWLYNRSAGNLLAVAIFHAAMNTFPLILPYSPPTLSLAILFAGAIVFTDRMWRSVERPAASWSAATAASPLSS